MDWKLFFLAFGMLFIAELGDKTQLTVFTLVTQYNKPLPIFLGASLGLVLVTLIGALFGNLVAKYIPTHYLQLIAGLLFVGIGIYVLYSALPEVMKSLQIFFKR
ncbi:TMEM165/GDT1 family protein [Calorimonas adulescens]|uniref:GDT1 family protein n=1 Tax=Calorimonas adulescens TaxID=2606906 RepID=A0A5D8QE57_9THEO|nr:TMEM165/GDT1 family protein [Calorimonas adulescens]TZE82459.1 TMEM165/GDT1 family protein [Calorimonas adulescens]